MRKNSDPIDQLFRSGLGELGTPVHGDFWEKLSADLPKTTPNRVFFIHRFAAAASILMILGIASAALWYVSQKEELSTAFEEAATVFKDIALIPEQSEIPPTDSISEPARIAFTPPSIIDKPIYNEDNDYEETAVFIMSVSESHYSYNNYPAEEQPAQSASYTDKNVAPNNEKPALQSAPSPKQTRWDIGLHGSYGLLTAQTTEAEHKHSWSVGMSVRRALSKHIRLESGITYTQLNSDINQTSSNTQTQTFHYVGIPVKVNASIKQTRKVDLYASAGGMAELCVKAHNATTPDPIQLSLTAAIGIDYKLSDQWSVYAEPGISYHFKDGSEATTLRKEKPLNMNLLCGVRMTF